MRRGIDWPRACVTGRPGLETGVPVPGTVDSDPTSSAAHQAEAAGSRVPTRLPGVRPRRSRRLCTIAVGVGARTTNRRRGRRRPTSSADGPRSPQPELAVGSRARPSPGPPERTVQVSALKSPGPTWCVGLAEVHLGRTATVPPILGLREHLASMVEDGRDHPVAVTRVLAGATDEVDVDSRRPGRGQHRCCNPRPARRSPRRGSR